jgi:hypothetical protein
MSVTRIPGVAAIGAKLDPARPFETGAAAVQQPQPVLPDAIKRADAGQVKVAPANSARPFERSVGLARDGSGVIIDLVIPPSNVPFARLFGGDDPAPVVNVKA